MYIRKAFDDFGKVRICNKKIKKIKNKKNYKKKREQTYVNIIGSCKFFLIFILKA